MAEALLNLGGADFTQEVYKENLKDRVIVLNDVIESWVIEYVTMQIWKFNKEDKSLPVESRKPIKIIVNSLGGEVDNGFSVIDIIKLSKTPVYTIVPAYAYSMGGLMTMAGHKRYIMPNATILVHDGNGMVGGSSNKMKDTMKFFDRVEENIKKFILSNTKITSELYDKMADREWYIFPEEAKELGIVDGIIGVDISLEDLL